MAKKNDNKRKKKTFKEIAIEWLETKYDVKESTRAQYRSIVYSHLIEKIGEQKMKKVCDTDFLQELARELSDEGYDRDTIGNYFTVLNSIIRYYKDMDEKRSIKQCIKECVPEFNRHEIQCIVAMASKDEECNQYAKLGILLVLYTGMSVGELCGLRWLDIDLKENYVHVDRMLHRMSDGESSPLVITEYEAKRVVPISTKFRAVINKYYKNGLEDCYVLSGTRRPMEPRSLQYVLGNLFKQNDMKNYTVKNLQYMFFVTAIRNNVSIPVLSEVTGRSIGYICERYGKYILNTEGYRRLEMKKISY